MKKIVILGAGYAGILTAKKLAKKTAKRDDIEITLIDKNTFHTMLTELHEVAACRVGEESIRLSLAKVFAGRKVKVVQDSITKIDYTKKEMVGENGSYTYDYAVIATGSKPAFYGVPGAEEYSFTLWSYDDAVKLRDHIENCFIKATKEPNEAKRCDLLNFCIVGSGFTGVETAGEIAEYIPFLCERFEIDRSLVKLTNVDALDRVCTALAPHLSARVQKRLEKMGVEVILKANIKSVEKTCINMDIGDGQGLVCRPASTVIWVAGVQGSTVSAQSKAIGEGRGGKIATNSHLQALNDPAVYVAGDNIFYTPEGETMPVPAMVENAEHSAGTVAHNILVDVLGEGKKEDYKPAFHGMMVCIGGRWGTAYGGMPGKFFGMPSFLAMMSKHFINIVYFIQVLGWNKIFSYLKHEFFTIRNKRSFLGGHFSNRSASFMLVPLRLFLGAYWVYEAIVKVLEGWLQKPMLDVFLGGANQWWDNIIQTAATNKAIEAASAAGDFNAMFALQAQAQAAVADTVTSASEGATTAVTNLSINWDFFGLVQWLVITGTSVATKIRIPFMDTMLNGLAANDTLAIIMQVIIVLVEIGVGLALMGGCFTTVMAAVSIGLQLMFLTSTGLYMESWWMLFASFAMMFGAGSVFSIDYYLMPCLKNCWKGTKLARKWYWYND